MAMTGNPPQGSDLRPVGRNCCELRDAQQIDRARVTAGQGEGVSVVAAQRQAPDRREDGPLRTCGVMDESSLVLASVVGVGDGGWVDVPPRVLTATARARALRPTRPQRSRPRGALAARGPSTSNPAHSGMSQGSHDDTPPDTLTCRISTKTSPRRPMGFDVLLRSRWLMLWNPARPLVLTDLMAIGDWCGDGVFTAAC